MSTDIASLFRAITQDVHVVAAAHRDGSRALYPRHFG
jgi:hypothetical protein